MLRKYVLAALALILISLVTYTHLRLRDRHRGYWLDYFAEEVQGQPMLVGFGKAEINPPEFETWHDVNGDARYQPEAGDQFEDSNSNGIFDAVWIAGFHNQRPAQGLHDTLWARSMVLKQGNLCLALVVIDAIGFGSDEIISIRKEVQNALPVDYLCIASTHSHQTPDLIGMWGPGDYRSGVNPKYVEKIGQQVLAATRQAYERRVETIWRYAEHKDIARSLVEDSRQPIVLDAGLRVLQAVDQGGNTLGCLVGWANHPETLWSDNLQLSADFPHFLRESLEKGIVEGDSLRRPGVGGITIFLNGAIGGLMTTSPRMAIQHPFVDTAFLEPSFDKAAAQGEHLAISVLDLLSSATVDTLPGRELRIIARSIKLPMQNKLFRLGAWLGILDRGMTGWFSLRSEIAYWQIDQIGLLHIPGEIYPEIVNGGIEAPPGQDFDIAPVEIPPLRELLPAEHALVVGLSNDMIGYIIPKSQWDVDPPHLYDAHDAPYGEINSLGPDTGPLIHSAVFRMIEDFKKMSNQ